MVSINGLPPSSIGNTQKTNRTNKKNEVKKGDNKGSVGQPTKVANAVSHSIRHVQESDIHKAQLQYDLPEGRARRAMEEYMDVMNQAKKEELAKLIGVDIYI
ncbi:MAG: chromosome partitioning protein ParA [Vibrio gallaecicus]|uniref:Chromosome partitioning protein ParA n=1 Tax=Vibrio gallaecicus TaxID=552386 RepID=A0ABV4NB94_9VIBR|nr:MULTISPECIES: chromosome partitioning protein ParA [Vibrio]MDN3613480.1 chromosome partitioning protein ParA [Vibrio gallaecicus]MDN3615835.1 chromosome partitioning protein ParA [Vibrio gallaecicus]NOH97867.1 chromosome partitioning protein ParA [Vibrio sp. 99-70-13A1]